MRRSRTGFLISTSSPTSSPRKTQTPVERPNRDSLDLQLHHQQNHEPTTFRIPPTSHKSASRPTSAHANVVFDCLSRRASSGHLCCAFASLISTLTDRPTDACSLQPVAGRQVDLSHGNTLCLQLLRIKLVPASNRSSLNVIILVKAIGIDSSGLRIPSKLRHKMDNRQR
ncbi:hypothetical protein BKA81DRAFT_227307 [Phyllosticta paracitricarpa]